MADLPATRFLFACALAAIALLCPVAPAQAAAPQVSETWVEGVSTNGAVFHAQVDGGGVSSFYRFEYIAEAVYLASQQGGEDGFAGAARTPVPDAIAGKGPDNRLTRPVSGLQQETIYRYRVVIRNADGTATGPERRLETQGPGGALVLLDGRSWEMVSPVDKNGGGIDGPEAVAGGGVFQAAAQGGAATFSSVASFGPGAGGAPVGSQYVSRRGVDGWTVENVTPSVGYDEEPDGVPYQLFSPELTLGLLAAPAYPPLSGSAPPGYANYYLHDSAGTYSPLFTFADVAGLTVPPQAFELSFAGASADLSHIVLSTCAALTADATEVPAAGGGCDLDAPNLYERSSSGWRLLNLLPGDAVGTPGATLAAPAGAVSSDGSRVYWSDGADLYLSERGAGTVQVDAGVGGGGSFQAASTDGTVVYFTRAGSLHRYAVATGMPTTVAGGVVGVLGASADGGGVYYLTGAGLFLNRPGFGTDLVAAGADAANIPPATGTARVSADGSRVAFLSSAALTEYDNTGPAGTPVPEVYLYAADTKRLICVSCNPSGERPLGPSSIPGAIANGQGAGATRAYKPRALSVDGSRLFFDSADDLLSADTNKRADVYEWEAGGRGSCIRPSGCLQLISAGENSAASFVDASAMGEDAFFLTADSLVGSDPGSVDLYDAREGGGFPEARPPFVCEEDACQPLPSPPDDPVPGTLVPSGGNPPVSFPKVRKAKPRHKKQHRRHHRRGGKGSKRGGSR